MADDPGVPTVFGWDASDYDWGRGPMDLAAAARDGIGFFTHKATEATGTRHSNYGEAMRRARDAGIPLLGAYHVVRSPANAAAEVDFCLAYVDAQTPWWRDWPHWFWQVDLEKWPYDTVPASEGEQFADIIEARTGRPAVIYASRGQYGNELTGTSHDLWNANYGTNPTAHYRDVYAARGGDSGPGWVSYSGRMPIFWQFGSRTTIGSQNICDANAYRGTLAQLKSLIGLNLIGPKKGNDMLLIKTHDDPTVYISEAGRYRPMTLESAFNAAVRAGHEVVTVATMAELEDLAGRPADEPVPAPPVDVSALAAALAPLLPTAADVAAAVLSRKAELAKAVTDEIGS